MNTKHNDEDVRKLVEKATSSMALSGNYGGLVFTAAVVFISLSSQNFLSNVLSSILIFTTFIFVLGVAICENVVVRCTKENFEDKRKVMCLLDSFNTVGFFSMMISLFLLAFYVNATVGIIVLFSCVLLLIFVNMKNREFCWSVSFRASKTMPPNSLGGRWRIAI